ncbi:Spy/CpxP family protein refolding chaperone [Serratia surfactantfaciens]|uniref:Spy/CpxP family protein refolding chaperone n=1 Tax=Serratia surfactantfaciens TaxID=2741499 RepID=UPI003EE11F8D
MKLTLKSVIGAMLLNVSFNSFAVSDPELSQSHSILSKQLELTSSQIEKLDSLKSEAEKNLESIDVSSVSDEEIAKSFETGKWNEGGIKQELDSIGKVQNQARYFRLLYLFRASQVLTPEQKKKFDTLLKQHELY